MSIKKTLGVVVSVLLHVLLLAVLLMPHQQGQEKIKEKNKSTKKEMEVRVIIPAKDHLKLAGENAPVVMSPVKKKISKAKEPSPCKESFTGIGIIAMDWHILEVLPYGPAAKAGLLTTDRLIYPEALPANAFKVGTPIDFLILRNGLEMTLHAVVGKICNDDLHR